jgi:hypothetical protein
MDKDYKASWYTISVGILMLLESETEKEKALKIFDQIYEYLQNENL